MLKNIQKFILKCKNDVSDGKKISKSEAAKLFNLDNEFIENLVDASNFLTRYFHGSKVDIEELANIKKIFVVKTVLIVLNLHFLIQKLIISNYHHLIKLLSRL